jgi:CRP/FNR family cyclic AMP-dependent transcriptional regulator
VVGSSQPRLVGYEYKFLDRLYDGRLPAFFFTITGGCCYFDKGQCKHFAPGDILLTAGNPCDEVTILEKGFAEVTRPAGQERGAFLRLCFEGEILGEEAMLDLRRPKPARAITATALTPVTAHTMSAVDMRDFLDSNPGAWERLAEDLSARLSNADSAIAGLSCDPPDWRLARLLCELIRHGGVVQADGGRRLPIDITQRRLANWIGASTEKVERILKKWRTQRIIRTGPRTVIVHDIQKLESIGHLK